MEEGVDFPKLEEFVSAVGECTKDGLKNVNIPWVSSSMLQEVQTKVVGRKRKANNNAPNPKKIKT